MCERAVAWIANAASEAIAARGVFHIVLAGGDTPRRVYAGLRNIRTDWHAWQFWFGDERCLSEDDPRRNSYMARETLLDHIPVPPTQVHTIRCELGVEQAAAHYQALLRDASEFDLVLLGLGNDGHTASLFPGNDWGDEPGSADVLAVYHSPKPPARRVSLGARRLARARCVLFLITGAGKRDAVIAWRDGAALPVTAIRPSTGVDVLVEKICIGS